MKRAALLLLAAACAAPPPAATGVQTVPDAAAAILKTAAVNGARDEIARSSDNAETRDGVYLDTLVGPTPPQALYQLAHPRAWLDAMVATHKVDGLFGIPGRSGHLPRTAFAIEVGEPFPAGHDTLAVVYDWCRRRFQGTRGRGGPASVWRDQFVRSDTGWTRVTHSPAVAATACTP